jgi:hypothetical protein
MIEKKILLSAVIFDETIYPRKEHNAAKVQEYAVEIDSINQAKNYIILDAKDRLLDGRHRHLAMLKNADNSDPEITVFCREDVIDDKDSYLESIKYNSMHGQQISAKDKTHCAFKMYGMGYSLDTIAETLAISRKTAQNATKDIRDREKKERKEKIFSMYLACHTQEDIAESVGVGEDVIKKSLPEWCEMENLPKSTKDSANFEDADFQVPLYNVWTFAKKSNEVSHFGNSEKTIVDNLLYLCTDPFDIVVDPFAGGGSTIDVCKNRLRRYFVSDRKPIVERKHEIRLLDVNKELPELNKRWSDVKLVYLDPPYWKQAENQYSNDSADLANMPIEEFNIALSGVVNSFAKKIPVGAFIALIIQPTQWKSENKQFTDHVFDMVRMASKELRLVSRISCPYSTQQCTPQQVNWAKENKQLLTLSRELILWEK